jgi:hypothetical protein
MDAVQKVWGALVDHPCMVISFILFGALGAVAEYFLLENSVISMDLVTSKVLAAGMLLPAILAAAVTRLLEQRLHCPLAARAES